MKRLAAAGALILISVLVLSTVVPGNNRTEIKDVVVEQSTNDIYIKNGKVVNDDSFKETDDFIKSQKIDSKYSKITDYGKGFTMSYYNDMKIDASITKVKTSLSNEDTLIEVYYDDFTETEASYEVYSGYSNMFLENNTKDHNKEFESLEVINGRDTHILVWNREKLKHIENDKNYYLSVEVKSNNDENEVYTILMKSSKPFESEGEDNYMDIVKSFRIIEKKANSKINASFKENTSNLNEETQSFYKKYFLDSDNMKWGMFHNDAPADLEPLNILEERMDYEFEFLVRYDFFSSPEIVPMSDLENAYSQGKTVELTFQTTYDYKSSESNLYEILDGKYDDYFKQYAENLKSFGHPVLFRLNNEMNGDWCEYSSYHFSKDTEIFKESWKHIYNIFEENGVRNVLWVWNPHDISFPDFNWNHYLNYYPGDDYVDIVGLTGYNNGTYYPGEVWRSFEEIYEPIYNEYSEIFEKPLMITEFSANSIGGDKVEWINDMFDKVKDYDRIKVAIWWNWIDWDVSGEEARIYKLDESEEMLDAFEEGLNGL